MVGPGRAKILKAVRNPRCRREQRRDKAQLVVIDGKRAAVGLTVRVRRSPIRVQQQCIKGENLDGLLLQWLRNRAAVNPYRVRGRKQLRAKGHIRAGAAQVANLGVRYELNERGLHTYEKWLGDGQLQIGGKHGGDRLHNKAADSSLMT